MKNTWKFTGKTLQKSWNFVSLEKWKPWHRFGARSVFVSVIVFLHFYKHRSFVLIESEYESEAF